MSTELRLQRQQLAKFIGDDPDAIRVFERLLKGYNTLINKEDESILYDPTVAYSEGDYAAEDNVIYQSRVSSNTGNTPSTSPTQWRILLEQGSNSNGEYVVFSSGVQVCWHETSATGYALVTPSFYSWTYPQAFGSTPPVKLGTIRRPSDDTTGMFCRQGKTNSATSSNWAHSSTAVAGGNFCLFAIGMAG